LAQQSAKKKKKKKKNQGTPLVEKKGKNGKEGKKPSRRDGTKTK